MPPPPKSRTLWPLPGGAAYYLYSLQKAVSLANDNPSLEVYIRRFRDTFPSVGSDSMAYSYIRDVLQSLDVLTISRTRVISPTRTGKYFAQTNDPESILLQILRSRVSGVEELIELLGEGPQAIRHLLARMQQRGFAWRSEWPVRFRLNWLRAAGAAKRVSERESSDRYSQWQLVRPVPPDFQSE
jgi:hypothetical protein